MQEEASGFAAFVGIDWADRKHDVCLQVAGADSVEASVVEHRPKAIEEWAHRLRERFAGQPIKGTCTRSIASALSMRRIKAN